MKLERDIFVYIEKELYDFEDTKKKFEDITQDIIHYTPPYEEIRTLEISDRTGKTALKLLTDKDIKRMEKVIYSISISLIKTGLPYREIFEDKYFKHPYKTWEELSETYGVDVSTIYRQRVKLIEKIDRRLKPYEKK